MTETSRRGYLRGTAVALTGLAGCLGRLTGESGPERVTPDDDLVDWKVSFDGPLETRPAVADGGPAAGATVYAAGGDAGMGRTDGELGPLAAIAADGGVVQWHEPLDRPPAGRPHPHGGDCYLVTGESTGMTGVEQRLRRFGPDGAEQWHTDPVDYFLWLLGIGGGRAYLGTSNDAIGRSGQPLYGASLSDGSWSWEVESGDARRGEYRDGQLLVAAGMMALAAYDPADGTEQWFLDHEPLFDGRGRFSVVDGTAYAEAPGDYGGITPIDLDDGTAGWTFLPGDVPTFVPTGAATDGDRLVATEYGGFVFGLDPADGSERWRVRTDGETRDPPLLVDGVAFVGDHHGTVHAIDAETGDVRWQESNDGPVHWRLLRRRGEDLVVATTSGEDHSELAVFDAGDGTERWRYETAADLSRPALGPDRVFVADEDEGSLLALRR